MANRWTAEQLAAIEADGDILVSAAAGSGKTAVLTERLAQRIADGSLSADSVLCVTFTNAAAAEMKQRIALAVSERAKSASGADKRRLSEQLALIGSADITTIDAFCLKAVRADFHLLGIDPSFKIADKNECELLKTDTANELFNRLYEEGDEDFLRLVSIYGSQRSDDALADLVISIHNYIQTEPDTHKWLDDKCGEYKNGYTQGPWNERILKQKDDTASSALEKIDSALLALAVEISGEYFESFENALSRYPSDSGVMKKYTASKWSGMLSDRAVIASLIGADYEKTRSALSSWKRARILAAKPDKPFAEEINRAEGLFKEARESVLSIKDMFSYSISELDERVKRSIYPDLKRLCELVKKFDRAYSDEKEARGELEFSDIEHLCLRLFTENPDVRKKYSEKYTQILFDEFQDTNALQDSIFTALCDKPKRFCVGDIKQSIYRFRGSDPSIFADRSELFARPDVDAQRIILSNNFRSRREVLDGVNELFFDIMRKSTGDVDYDDTQRLNVGDKSWENVNGDAQRPELCLIESGNDVDMRTEARFIAKKIAELKASGFSVRGADGKYRPLKNSDIVIIMSSVKSADDMYTEELGKASIPVIALSHGYFERSEIKLMISLIKIISNPIQDIPLIAVMRSVVGGFSDDELAKIRIAHKDGDFYHALISAAEDNKKCADFLKRLKRWRDYSKYMSVDRLIWTLYEETGFYDFAGAYYTDGGAQANLRLLYGRAKQYENTGFKGLFNFISYIERAQEANEEISAAQDVSESSDAVRLMTIHKSKGLEFPVVFIARCASRFMLREDAAIPMNKKYGFGAVYTDAENGYTSETPMSMYVRGLNKGLQKAEEMRKLYVAMTRAKEKLILTAVIKDIDKFTEEISSLRDSGTQALSDEYITGASSFVSWAAAAAKTSKLWLLNTLRGDIEPCAAPPDEAKPRLDSAQLSDQVFKILGWKYPYRTTAIPAKISVSDIKRINEAVRPESDEADEDDLIISRIEDLPAIKTTRLKRLPAFMEKKAPPSGAALGTIYHTIMAEITVKEGIDEEFVNSEIARMIECGIIPKSAADAVDAHKIAAFFGSDIGRRMIRSPELRREAPFELAVRADEIPGGGSGTGGERVIVQGIIDCMFREDGGYVLVDYKSDYYTNPADIRKKYDIQLKFYKHAIEKITKAPVKEAVLYLFHNNDTI